MKLPDLHLDITSTMVAGYAAVVSTVTAIVQLANFLRDRIRVKVKVSHNMQIIGDDRYKDEMLTIVTVTNLSRRPVTITTVGAKRLFPLKTHYVFPDVKPQLPKELTDGKYVQVIIKSDGLDVENISTWEAYSSTDKVFSLAQAPWRKRVVSNWKSKRCLKQEAIEKSEKTMGAKV
jgi:hypothetical protein